MIDSTCTNPKEEHEQTGSSQKNIPAHLRYNKGNEPHHIVEIIGVPARLSTVKHTREKLYSPTFKKQNTFYD